MQKRLTRLEILCVVVALIGGGCFLMSGEKLLLQQATVAWQPVGVAQELTTVHWLTPTQFLTFRWDMSNKRLCTDVTHYDLKN